MKKLLERLVELNISLVARDAQLDIYDPNEALTDELLSGIKENRSELLSLLKEVNIDYKYVDIPVATKKDHYKLSSAQKRLYFLHEFDTTSLAYNLPQVVKLYGHVDKKRLDNTFRELIQRHESLRTSFELVNGEPVQVVADDADFEITQFNTIEQEAETLIRKFVQPFMLDKAPLLRVALIELPKDEYLMLVDMHHIITDGVSHSVLVRDFMALYNNDPLPALQLQYKDYAEWQQGNKQQQKIAAQKAFWLRRFSELPPVLELPVDFPRPLVQDHRGGGERFSLTAAETRSLKLMAEAEGATLFMVLLSAYNILLARLSNQEDIVVGTAVAGRQHADLKNIVGMFVNTLPLRNYPTGSLSFRELLSAVKASTVAAFENQEYQYEQMVEELKIERDMSRNPLFDTTFSYQNFEETYLEIPGIRLEPYNSHHAQSKFDMTLAAAESGEQLVLDIVYSTALFRKETIRKFADYFRRIISAIVADVNIKIADINLLSAEETTRILFDFNDTKADFPSNRTLTDLFEEQVRNTPSNTALMHNDSSITYSELNEKANQLAHYLVEKGIKEGAIVALMVDRSIEMIIGILGILKAGGSYLPIDTEQPEQRVQQVLTSSGAVLLLTQINYAENTSNPGRTISPESVSNIIYTSGSTGTPKGVMVRHSSMVNFITGQKAFFGMNEDDRVLQFSSISFDASGEQIWTSLLSGAALVLIDKEILTDNSKFNEYLSKHGVTHIHATPSFLETIDLHHQPILRRVVAGGEACRPQLAEKYSGYRFYNKYGPTETTITSIECLVTSNEITQRTVSIGKPVNNTQVYILGRNYEVLPENVQGELFIAGAGLAKGYLNDEALTRQKFIDNPFAQGEKMYRTGDIAKWLPNGNIEYVGRMDEQVKIRGFRIETGEIASQLKMHERVLQAVVIPKELHGEKQLVAYYKAAEPVEPEELKWFLSSRLPDYMVPAYYVQIDELPLTASGKVNKRALPEPEIAGLNGYVAPSDDTEEELVEIWADILKLDRSLISVNSSFFELGGHSLRATLLINRIFKALQVSVPLREIFRHQTIESLAAYIRNANKAAYISIGKALQQPYYKLSSAQKRLYFLHELDKDSTAYNMPKVVKLEGNVDKRRLEDAFKKLIERHENLRTYFEVVNGEAVQMIAPQVEFEIAYFGLSGDEADDIINSFMQPFVLSKAPLLRVGLIMISPKEFLLLTDMHHIITDGVSQAVLISDFMALYNNQPLPPLKLQYKDYSEWQQSDEQQKQMAAKKDFWLRQFAEMPAAPELPVDHPRPMVRNHKGGVEGFVLSVAESKKIRTVAEAQGVTDFMALLGTYNIFLSKLSNQEDIVIGIPVAGRNHADLESIVGMFVNTIPLRNYPAGNLSFSEFLSEIKTTTLASFENQEYQYEELIDALKLERDNSRNPLFDAVFTYHNFEQSSSGMNDLALKPYDSKGPVISKFDLSLSVEEVDSQFVFNMGYAACLFEKETIQQFITYFKKIIATVFIDTTTKLSAIELLTEEQKQQQVRRFNDTKTDYPSDKTVVQLLEQQVANTPDGIALVYNDEVVTYRQMSERSNQLAHLLQKRSLKTGQCVAVLAERSIDAVIAIIAILKAGGIYVPLDTNYPKDRLEYMLKDSNANIVLAQSAYTHLLPYDVLVIECETAGEGEPLTAPQNHATASDVAYVMYTSGSTGRPKGVAVTNRNVVRLVKNTNYVNLDASTRILQTGAPAFDATTFEIWGSLLNGGRLYLANKEVLLNTALLSQTLKKYDVNTMWLTASLFDQHAGEDISMFEPLSCLIIGGDVVSVKSVNAVRAAYPHIQVVNGYGPTENTTFSVCHKLDRYYTSNVPIGKPISNSTAYIIDKYGHLQPPGIAGELCVGGDGVSIGYLNNEALTKEKFVADPFTENGRMYKTGDMARWLPDGTIEFLGRLDNQVKIRGFRIELGEIAHALNSYNEIKESVVIVRDQDGNKSVVAYYTAEQQIDIDELRDYLSGVLPDYMVPSYFMQLESLPLNTNGKIDRKALPDPEIPQDDSFVLPSNSIEEKLVEIWAAILMLEPEEISVKSSFFELGGHSLRAVALLTRLSKEFQVDVPLGEIFEHDTIRDLATYIGKAEKAGYTGIPKAQPAKYYNLSSAQKRLHFLYEFDKDSLSYNIPRVVRLEGNVDRQRLEEAFRKLISRHEILRTSFEMLNGEPVQTIAEQVDFEITSFKTTEAEVENVIREFIRPFILEKAPLIRVAVLELSAGEHLLVVDMHHIVTDGVSHKVLVTDFMALYNGQSLPELKLHYKDYAKWQQSDEQQKEMAKQKNFWLDKFSEIPAPLELPVDYPRPAVKGSEGAVAQFHLSASESARLTNISKEEGTTLFMVLLAAYNILLARLSNQDDIVVGIPVAGRRHADLQNMVGLFVNTLLLRNQPKGDLSFTEFLSAVKAESLASIENQDYQYEELIDVLKVKRDLGRNPLFDAMFSFQNFEDAPLEIQGLTLKPYTRNVLTLSNFDITLIASEHNGQISFEIEYSTELFENKTIEKFIAYFNRILSAIGSEPAIKIAAIELLSAEEKHQLLNSFNNTYEDYPRDKTLVQLFEEQVARTPGNIALIHDDQEITYKELNEKANQLAHYLRGRGVEAQNTVALMVDRSMEMIIGMLGILKAGAAYLPLEASQQEARIIDILSDCKPAVLLTEGVYVDTFSSFNTINIRDSKIAGEKDHNLQLNRSADSLAYIIYTSGSTGKPKGVLIKHQSVVNILSSRSNEFRIEPTERILQSSTIAFDASVEQIWLALLNGAAVVLIHKEVLLNGSLFNEYIVKHRVTHLDTTPSFLESTTLDKRNSLKRIAVGGEECSVRLAARMIHDYKFYNEYGPTETTIVSIATLVTEEHIKGRTIPIGRPIGNTSIYILGKYGELLPAGIKGELYIAGHGLAAGYLNDDELTKKKFVDNPFSPGQKMYRTGDLAMWRPDGNIDYLGRIDEQVKIRGYRVETGEIEARLAEHGQIDQVVVVIKETGGEKYLVVYYTSEKEVDRAALRKYLSERLPDYMVPSYYIHLNAIPLTRNGKVDRRALPEPELVRSDDYTPPANDMEKQLVEIWAGVLKLDAASVSVTGNFFEIGGHSLRASMLINRIAKEMEVALPLRAVFTHPTIRGMADHISKAERNEFISIKAEAGRSHYMLSSAQKRMYFLYEFDKGSLAYNMPQVTKLHGTIDKDQLNIAFKELIQRHESLRTSFELLNGEPVQIIADDISFEIAHFSASEHEAESIIRNFVQPFNLNKAPLLRVGLIELPQHEWLLMVDMHHIITDGVSQSLLVRDFTSLYNKEPLPALQLQYKDYAEWQQSEKQQKKTAEQKEFWLQQFAELPPVLELPTDFSRPMVQEHIGGVESFSLSVAESRGLKLMAEAEGATLFMVLLSAYNILLARLSNQEDIVIGTPVAGRQHADLENIVGLFVNTLPLRNYPKGNLNFRELLGAVKAVTLAAFENQEYQYEELIDELKVERDMSRNPLFDTMFSYQNFEETALEIPGVGLESYDNHHMLSKFDITLAAGGDGENFVFDLVYSTALFRAETIRKFADYFKRIISAVVADANIKIADIDILSAEERTQLLLDFNDTKADYPTDRTLTDLFEEQVLKTPFNKALIYNERSVTYSELNEKANQLAHHLVSKGVKQGSIVALMIDRSIEMIVGILGILKAGGAYLPIDAAQPGQRVQQILKESGAALLLTQIDYADDTSNPELSASPADTSNIIYTSGSTGVPKGVMVKHRSMVNFITGQKIFFGMSEDDRVLQFSSISFDASGEQIWTSLLSGAALVLIDKEILTDNPKLNQYLSMHGVTHIHATPSFLESVELHHQPTLRRVVAGGEACRPQLAEKYSSYKFYNKYGPTETTITSIECLVTSEEIGERTVSIGKPVNNTQVYILGSNNEPLPVNVKGELFIAGAGLAKGYLNDESLTNLKFIDNPFVPGEKMYRTGDLAKWLPNGNIEYLGRIDEQVKIRGFRIETGEVESRLKEHTQVSNAVVIAKQLHGEKQLVAYYVSAEAIDAAELKNHLLLGLPEYMVPAYYVHMNELPLTASNKINRKALPDPEIAEGQGYTAPAGPVEEKLVHIWSEILKVPAEQIGRYNNFFELGGHSLRTTVLANRIFKEFNVEVPLKEIFSNQTISTLAAYIAQAEKSGYASIGKAADKPYYRLSSAQKRLFVLYQFDRTSLAYNMPQVAKLQGRLDKERLNNAFRQLIARHESLRTYFEVIKGEIVQKIAPQVAFEMEMYAGNDADVLIAQFIRPFDLHKAPLIRAGIIGLSDNEHLLMIDTHHIIKDGVSSGVLNRDLVALYNNEELPELKLQYKDFAEWQQEPAQQQKIAKQRNFWINEYAEEPTRLELTTDFARPMILSQEGGSVGFELSEAETRELKAIASKEGATLFMVMFAVYNVMLSRLSNQEDVVVGIPTAGRQHADLDNVIGMFVNTLPMRSYPRKKLSFREFVAAVKTRTIAGFDNQAYPYETLIDELKIARDTSRNPLFDTIFVYQNFEDVTLHMPGLTLTPYDSGYEVAKFDITLSVAEQSGQLLLSFGYSKALFRKETIERFAGYFRKIIDAVTKNANIKLVDIELLSQAEQDTILHAFNDTAVEYPQHKTVMDVFDEQVAKNPDNIAVITGKHVFTYKQLKESSDRMASYFVHVKGVKPGALIGLLMEREEQLLPVIFGVLKAGAAYVPIDPAYPADRILAIVEDSELSMLVSRKKYLDAVAGLTCTITDLSSEMSSIDVQQPLSSPVQAAPDSLAYVIYTSGSTGKPKGVMIAHRSLTNIIFCLQRMYPLHASDRYLFKTTYTFDVSVAEIFGWFPGGGSISLLEPGAAGDPLKILDTIAKDNITHINFVPSMFAVFVEAMESEGAEKVASLKYIFLAGEALPAELVKRFHALNTTIRLENIYGPTEATIYACGYSIDNVDDNASIPIGRPIDNTRLYVVDSNYNLQPVGVPGELCIAGDGLAKGYLNNEALTNEKFIYHPGINERIYRTGDLAKWLPDGNIDYLGRIDAQVKIRGFRIELSEIEGQLNMYPGVSQAVVIAKERPGDKFLVAYYVSPNAIESRELKTFLSGKLPEYMLPAYYVHLQQMPLTPSGKINRKLLPQPEIGEGRTYIAPVGMVEEKLVDIWSEVLETGKHLVGVDANFFEMGGHSLKATKLLFRIQKHFNADVSLLDVFRFPTIREFAQRLNEVKDVIRESNDLLIRLKQDANAKNNFFFIHEGSGDVQGYTAFAGLMKGFNCWGIRSVTLRESIPLNIELEPMAMQYAEIIRSVQPRGPYYLAGWSYGGVIAFEIARQLEAAGEKVEMLMMIDSQFPVTYSRSGYTRDTLFTLEEDRQLLYEVLGAAPAELREAKTLKELWENSFAFLEKGGEGLAKIKNMIPSNIRSILPHADEIGIEDLVSYVNSIRTIERTVVRYHPDARLQVKLLYIRALDTKLDLSTLSNYFNSEPEIVPVEGSHFTILLPPRAEKVAREVLDRVE
jgi:tyrocidine synthetase III